MDGPKRGEGNISLIIKSLNILTIQFCSFLFNFCREIKQYVMYIDGSMFFVLY